MAGKQCRENFDFQCYVDQQMTLPDRVRFEKHVGECRSCAHELSEYKTLFVNFQAACAIGPEDSPTPADLDRTMARIAACHPKNALIPGGSAFNLAGGLESFWRFAFAGIAFCLILAIFWPRGIPSSPISPKVTRMATHPIEDLFSYILSAPPKYSLEIVGAPAAQLLTKGQLKSETLYHLPTIGKLYVTYRNENRLEFSQQSKFEIAPQGGLRLLSGNLWCKLQKSGHDLVIQTPNGTITPLGTKFFVEVTPLSTRVTLEEGQVVLRTRSSTVSMKRPGNLFMMTDGSIISPSESEEFSIQPLDSQLPQSRRTLDQNPQADSLNLGY
ncbi:hypothetical protein AUK22_08985 [bacterium CG2_30_54_10]|nr:MAG: hypothetical protein AUK22_08985 [bacterium CG2_30_54_10]